MKTFFTKYKLLIWVVLILLIINISAITTIFYRNILLGRIITRPPAIMRFHRPGPGVFLKDELNLSDDQFSKFNETRTNYQKAVLDMNRQINTIKKNYMHELMVEKPDKALMEATCDSIGAIHVRLMQETGKYYNQIRQLCRDDQVEKLNTFFIRAMQDDRNAGMQGRGKGMRGFEGGPGRPEMERRERRN